MERELPNLNIVTFNTIRFYDRKAVIGDKILYYMILKPKTLPASYKIDKLVFRLPEEFGYPDLSDIDQCEMIGKDQTPISDCKLNRVDRRTLVNFVPKAGDYDDHAVKIVRISFTNSANLFKAPQLPGDHYNMTLSMYSGNTLVEQTDTNLTTVKGSVLDKTKIIIHGG